MHFVKRLSQPRSGAAAMLGVLAAIELGQLVARAWSTAAGSLMSDRIAAWMLLSVLISGTVAWRLFRNRSGGRATRRNLIVVLLHAAGCWRFLEIELAILATLPVFALAAAWWLETEPPAGGD